MDFRILGLPAEPFRQYFAMTDGQLAAHRALRRTVDETPGAPCRVSLADAEPGEDVVLLHYEHHAVESPYRSSHAIYVRATATERFDRVNVVPEVLRTRLLSVRAFDARHLMVDCDVTEGRDLEALLQRLLGRVETGYVHVHFARAGCYAARVERA